MTNTVSTVQEAYLAYLRSTITDPNPERLARNKAWIYDDLPASTIGAGEYPRISILAETATVEPHELGATTERVKPRVEVQIRSRRNIQYGSQTGNALANSLAVQCSDAMRSPAGRAHLLSQANVFYNFLEQENSTFINDIVIKTLVFKNIMTR